MNINSTASDILRIYLLVVALLVFQTSMAQQCSNLQPNLISELTMDCASIPLSMIHDSRGLPYLFVANKDAGFRVIDLTDSDNPNQVAEIPVSDLGNLHVMNLCQNGNMLLLALGNHFSSPQQAGIAAIDITNPASPQLSDYLIIENSESGAGIVSTEGEYAYLGAMKSGLVIIDLTDLNNLQEVSRIVPDINYPVNNPSNVDLYNARGMVVENDIVYLCFDAGGLRIINCTNKVNPVETGRYANPALFVPFNLPRAYNNVVKNGNLLYVAVDYCGVEVLDISDTSAISLSGWWNPYDCPGNNWFTSPVHANEIRYLSDCATLLVSTGKSDMYVLDVSTATQPDSCGIFGGTENNIGTWGVNYYGNEIYLSYICTLGIPFASNWSGIKLLSTQNCNPATIIHSEKLSASVFPNPASSEVRIQLNKYFEAELFLFNAHGEMLDQIRFKGNNLSINTLETY
ncbi:MAG: hypothetical protein KDC13_09880, partial [Bacteroidetes bacterium]|nr:hypothetical protein [Bacteroidota bacterium]